MTRDQMTSETLAETLQALPVPPRRRLMAGLTAAALALSVLLAQAAPVRAGDNDDLLAALAALAAIGVIAGAADNDRGEEGRGDTRAHRRDSYQFRHSPSHASPSYHDRHEASPRHAVTLPAICAIEIEGRDRDRVVYTERCLDTAGVRHLPPRCARELSLPRGTEWVYAQSCLRAAGYSFQAPLRRDYERPD